MKLDVDIRELGPGDAEAYKALRVDAAADPSFGLAPESEEAYSVELLEQVLRQDDGSYILGAFDGEELVGMVGFGRGMKPGTGTLFGLFVRTNYRSQRVGAGLCKALIVRQPRTTIRLEVTRHNAAATSLYAALGFVETIRNDDTVVMVRPPVQWASSES